MGFEFPIKHQVKEAGLARSMHGTLVHFAGFMWTIIGAGAGYLIGTRQDSNGKTHSIHIPFRKD